MKTEIKRLTSMLKETNPLSSDYGTLLTYIERLEWLSKDEESVQQSPVEEQVKEEPIKVEVKVEEPAVEEEPIAIKDEVIIEKAPVEEKKNPTYEEVRAIFKDAAASGVIIRPVIEKFTPEGVSPNLSAIPANKYAELLEELNNAR